MGTIREVHPAALMAGVTFSHNELLEQTLTILSREFGPFAMQSEPFDFTMTDYYTREMGEHLWKLFCCFAYPIRMESLPDIKLRTNEIELMSAQGNSDNPQRRINIDPGYVTLSKLVLATTKDYSHRIYIGKGIYAEVTLRFHGGSFVPLDTTYPDYRTLLAIDFFNSVRDYVRGNKSLWTQHIG